MKKIFYIQIITFFLILAGCNTEDELKTSIIKDYVFNFERGNSGTADFSKYIAVGASFTAGFMDGALYDAGQRSSYPAIIANQMRIAGGGSFLQPDINSANGFNRQASDLANNIILGRYVLNAVSQLPEPLAGDISSILTPYSGNLNNFAVPGARVVDLIAPQYGTPDLDGDGFPEGNPYYVRFASTPGTSTILGDAVAAKATFFSLQIGANDVLGWAITGGTAPDVANNPAAIANPNSLTDIPTFTGAMGAVVAALRAGGAKGVISTIGDLTLLPFFSTVPYNALVIDDQAIVDALNSAFAGFNAAIDGLIGAGLIPASDGNQRKVSYTLGANPFLIEDDNLADLSTVFDLLETTMAITAAQRVALTPLVRARHIRSEELVLITAQDQLSRPVPGNPALIRGLSFPLGDEFTLTEDELAKLDTRVTAFNNIISSHAVAGEVGIVDLDIFSQIIVSQNGVAVSPFTLDLSISPNGIFSMDFIHPNPRGMAIFANEFISAINNEFGATVPMADVLSFPGLSFK